MLYLDILLHTWAFTAMTVLFVSMFDLRLAISILIAIAVGKEIFDSPFSVKDLVFDAFGVFLGLILRR